MLARKFDRIEHRSQKNTGGIMPEAGEAFKGEAGLLDDIRDLRRYLLLVENDILISDSEQETKAVYSEPVTSEGIPTGE